MRGKMLYDSKVSAGVTGFACGCKNGPTLCGCRAVCIGGMVVSVGDEVGDRYACEPYAVALGVA